MSSVAAPQRAPRRRGGFRFLVVIVIVLLVVAGVLVALSVIAQAAVNAPAILTVYQPSVSVKSGTGSYSPAPTGALVQAGESLQTDTRGRASISLPDGTTTRMAGDTTITLDSAHFAKTGNVHDVRLGEQVGRTLTNVQRLISGATFQVAGKSATATVRGTRFEVYIKADGTMIVKLFDGTLDFDGKNHVHLVAGEQAIADPDGNISPPTPIQPDPNDPFGPELAASNAVDAGTTPGTEQDYIGAPLHNGEQQRMTYSYAGGTLVKASLGYPGSAMSLTVLAPDGHTYTATGASPVTVVVDGAPAGIYTAIVRGVSGLGAAGEEPFIAVASVESCVTADVDQAGAVHRGYTAGDLSSSIRVTGLSNLRLSFGSDSVAGAIVSGSGTYNGIGWSGVIVLVARNGSFDLLAVSGTIFGISVPAPQIVQQIGSMIGQDPSNIAPGFYVDRLFTCNSVLMVDGRHTA